MIKYHQLFFLIFISVILPGCASVTTGCNQSVSVNTEPHKQANCELSNDKGTWYIPNTPGSVVVQRAYSNLNVICKKDTLNGSTTVKSSTKGMAFGNILAGGLIGAGVDMSTGAAYDYPYSIHVPLK